MTNAVLVNYDNGIADVRINRPEKRNAIDSEVIQGLLATADEIKANPKFV